MLCWEVSRSCHRCATYKARLYVRFKCEDGSYHTTDYGCGSC